MTAAETNLLLTPLSTKCRKNVVYEFDHMQPWPYVAQTVMDQAVYGKGSRTSLDGGTWLHASWDSRPARDDLKLMSPTTCKAEPDDQTKAACEAKAQEWQGRTFYYTVTDTDFKLVAPVLQADLLSSGAPDEGVVYFDQIELKEWESTGDSKKLVREVILPLDDLAEGWATELWEGDARGEEIPGSGAVGLVPPEASHDRRGAISISGTTTLANLSYQALDERFTVTTGNTYEVSGWMRGFNISEDAEVMIRLDFWSPLALERTALGELLEEATDWGKSNGVPMSASGFGTSIATFGELRGLELVTDTIDLMVERNLHFSYYAYRDPTWGLSNAPDSSVMAGVIRQISAAAASR